MSPLLRKSLRAAAFVASALVLLVLLAAGWGWWRIRRALPALDGRDAVPGLSAPVTLARDAQGVPTITGATRVDVARALGYAHGQDRFFQMDLLRRNAAGELSELFGEAALPLDRARRLHGVRRTAAQALARLDPAERALVEAYAAGVNAGLASLSAPPWEYALLRAAPRAWEPVDSVLVIFSMWFDLQESSGRTELSRQAVRDATGQAGADFLSPRGTAWDAAVDGSTFPATEAPPFRWRRTGPEPAPAADAGGERLPTGSNSMAVAGNLTASGAGLLENDMHLSLGVPHIWYRAVLQWTDAAGTARRVVGVTLPGACLIVAGSNGSVAWGFTNSYVDTADVIVVEADSTAQAFYRTPHGFTEIEERRELIPVKGRSPVPFTARWTEWGPVIGGPDNGRLYVLRWVAHDPSATNASIVALETATTVDEAVAAAHHFGMPHQNLVVADKQGGIAWTITGRVPRRVGFDGRFPVSWAYGDRRWDGWLGEDEIPAIKHPAEGLLWTANQRVVGGADYAKLGDGGYDKGPRAGQIRDDLRRLVATGNKVRPQDLLDVALDDRALFLDRWQKLLLGVLTDEAVAAKASRRDLRDAVRRWDGHAGVDSAAYRIVRTWRLRFCDRALAPFVDRATARYAGFNHASFQTEDALWLLAHDRPAALLNPDFASWNDLLLSAADAVSAEIDREGGQPARFTWGAYNTLRMQHPFSRFLPAPLARLLDMPADPLPGGNDMPRVQGPSFGASERLVVSPGHEEEGLFHMPGGQSGNPLSPYYRAGHEAWVTGRAAPLLPGPAVHTRTLEAAAR